MMFSGLTSRCTTPAECVLEATIAQQQKSFATQEAQIKALTSGLQKVSAQIETSKPVLRVVANEP
jgi:septal ring factor EnvC (AmiA/AmiB activator)